MPGRDHADNEGPWLQFVKSTLTTSNYKPITFMMCLSDVTHTYKLIIFFVTYRKHVLRSILGVY